MKIIDKELIEKTILEWEEQQTFLQVTNNGFYVVPSIYGDLRWLIYGGKRFSVFTSPKLIMTVSQNELTLINDHTCDIPKTFIESLFNYLNEKIFNIKKKDDEKEMNNKELISHKKLFQLVCEWLNPFIDEQIRLGGYWSSSLMVDGFYWHLAHDIEERGRTGSSRLCDNHWEIYNRICKEEKYTNIKIFDDHIEFIEDSEFTDFTKEEMYSLYTFLKERIFGIKEEENKELLPDNEAFKLLLEWLYDYEKFLKKYLDPVRKRILNMPIFEIEEEINKMGVQNENSNEGSKFESAMNNYDGDVTKHRKSDELDKMRAMVNGFHLPKKIDWDEINITNVEKPSKPYRPSKDHYYLNIAKEVAMRGTCLRRKFGAVIVNNDEIVSTGYVGAPRGRINCTDRGVCFRQENNIKPGTRYELCRSVHAEMNAVISAGRDRCIGATLYLVGIENDGSFTSNTDCCSMCKRVIINAGIEKVVFRTPVGQRTVHVKEDWINDDDSLTIHEGY